MDRRHQTEAIPLRCIEFKERQRIVTFFTKDKGLLTLILKGITQKKPLLLTLSTPFCIAEIHYLQGKSDLHYYQDATLLSPLSSLRTTYTHLLAATTLAHTLLTTQLPEKSTPPLYHLFKAYLLHLHTFPNPAPLTFSFQLKLLLHDGHLSPIHPPHTLTHAEWSLCLPYLLAKHFTVLPQDPPPQPLQNKITSYLEIISKN